MLFNQNKGFFLTLDETAEPVRLDLPEAAAVEEPAADASVTEQPSLVVAAVEAPAASEAIFFHLMNRVRLLYSSPFYLLL